MFLRERIELITVYRKIPASAIFPDILALGARADERRDKVRESVVMIAGNINDLDTVLCAPAQKLSRSKCPRLRR